MPDKVVFYLEGPSPGIDLLIQSVVITCSSPKERRVLILIPFCFPLNDFGLLYHDIRVDV